jgi:hypothetical protein
MKSSAIAFACLAISACGSSHGPSQSSSSGGSGSVAGTGTTPSGSQAGSGTTPSGSQAGSGTAPTSGAQATSGSTSTGASLASGANSGSAGGSGASGSEGDASSGGDDAESSEANAPGTLPDGSVNMVPAGYAGTPFTTLTIPGFIYAADYDSGGAGVAYCHSATGTGTACANGIDLNDWCCGTHKGCGPIQNAGPCPLYRQPDDDAGLSHMNQGEPDDYATTGPSWVAGTNGPTLTGPMVTAGTPVPQDAASTTVEDAYISYMNTGQWSKYTVEVLEAGTYSVGGLMGVPNGTMISLDFGNGISTGTVTLPTSPCTWTGCPETYHSWNNVANIGMVTFPAPGTYVMTFTLVAEQFNPSFFTFTKM